MLILPGLRDPLLAQKYIIPSKTLWVFFVCLFVCLFFALFKHHADGKRNGDGDHKETIQPLQWSQEMPTPQLSL